MDQPQYGGETRRPVGDMDRQDYGVQPGDDQERGFPPGDAMPPPKVHHERHDPFEGHTGVAFPQASPPGSEPRKVPSGLDKPEEMMNPPAVAGGFEGESMEKELEDKRAFQGSNVPEQAESGGVPSEKLPSSEKEPQGGGSAAGGGIIDIHNLKDDYVDLSEGRSTLPSADSPGPDERSDVFAGEREKPEDSEGPAGERGGLIDVNSLKDDYIDLSEHKDPLPDEVVHEPQESSGAVPEEISQGKPTEGEGFIDVHNIKDDYTDLSRGQQDPGSDVYSAPQSVSPAGAPSEHEDTARLTSQIKSPADDPKQEEAAEIHKPAIDHAQFPQTLQDEGGLKDEENAELSSGFEHPESGLGEEQQTGDGISMDPYKPESGGFHSAGIVTDHPRDLDDVGDVQEASKQADQELPPPSAEENIGAQDAEEIDRPESKVPDPTYVLGGRPEPGIVVPNDSKKNAQERNVDSFGDGGERDAPLEALDGGKHDYEPGAMVTDVVGEQSPPQDELKVADEEKENVIPRELPLDMAYGGAGVSEVVDAGKKEETESAGPLDDNILAGHLHDDKSEEAEEKTDVAAPLDKSKRENTSFDEQARDLSYEPSQAEAEAEEMEKFGVNAVEGDDVGELIDEKSGVEPQIADYSTRDLPIEESKEVKGDFGDRDEKSDLGLPVLDDRLATPPVERNAEVEAAGPDSSFAVLPEKDSTKEHIKFDAEEPDCDAEEPDVAPAVPADPLDVGIKRDQHTRGEEVPQPEDALNLEHGDMQDKDAPVVADRSFLPDTVEEVHDKPESVAHGSTDVMEDVGAPVAIPLEKNVGDTADEQPELDPEVHYDTRDLGEQEGSLGEKESSLSEEPIPDHVASSLPGEQEGKMEAPSVDHGTVYAPEENSGEQKMGFGDGEEDVSSRIPADIVTAGMKAEKFQKDPQPDQALDSEQGGVQEPDISKSEGAEVVPQAEFGDREDVSRGIPADIFTAGMKGEEGQTTLQKDPQPYQALDSEQGDVEEPEIHKSERTDAADNSVFSGTTDGIEGAAVPLDKDIGDGTHLDEPTEGAPGDEYSKDVAADLNDKNLPHGGLIDGHNEEAEVSGADVSTDSALAAPILADTQAEEKNAEMKGEAGDEVAHPPPDSTARPPNTESIVPPQDDVKREFGGAEPVPKPSQNRDLDLTEAMQQEEERKQTDDHPLEEPAPKEGATEGEAPMASLHRHVDAMADDGDEQAAPKKEGDGGDLQGGHAISGHGKEGGGEDLQNVEMKSRDITPAPATAEREPAQPPIDDQHEREHPHKKGVFERIKDKLTPPYHHIHSPH